MSRSAKWKVRVEPKFRTVYMEMSGIFDEAALEQSAKEILGASATFGGKPHLCIADMRGLKAMKPAVAALMGQAIGRMRSMGVVLCAHLSDDIVARLQASRVARTYSQDGATVEVDSIVEAERVLDEKRVELGLPMVSPRSA